MSNGSVVSPGSYDQSADDGTSDSDSRTFFEYAAFSCSLFMLVCCIVGMFGNAISVLIFTRPVMQSSINVLLTGLSLIDLLMLTVSIPVFVVPNFNMYFKQKLVAESYYKFIVFGPYQIGMVAQTSSVWTFILISCERYLAVCHPLKVSRLVTVTRAKLALLGIVFTAVGYNLVRFFEYRLVDSAESNHQASDDDISESEEMAGSPGYQPWLRGQRLYFVFYHIGLYLLTHFLGPFVIITVLNVLILIAMKKSRAVRAKLMSNIEGHPDGVRRKFATLTSSISLSGRKRRLKSKTTQMIIVVTALFLICNTLPFVLNIWEACLPQVFVSEDRMLQAIAYILVDLSNTLVVFNSASTFILYVVYCQKYRDLFKWYCLSPVQFLSKDKSFLRRHRPLYLANQSSSLDSTRLQNFADTSAVERRSALRKSGLETAAIVSPSTVPFLTINDCSDSDGSSSRKCSAPYAKESQHSVVMTVSTDYATVTIL